MGWAPATPARPHFPLLCRRRRPVSGASQNDTNRRALTRMESMDVHTGTVVLHDDEVERHKDAVVTCGFRITEEYF